MARQPAIFVCHGAGPSFFVDWPFGAPDAWYGHRDYLLGLLDTLPSRPRAALIVTAHHEAPRPTVSSAVEPGQGEVEDMKRFPAALPDLTYLPPGDPALAARVLELLEASNIAADSNNERPLDHGVWVPLKLMAPNADLPVVSLSLIEGLDPAAHLAVGAALEPLRDEGVLIIGSGSSFHRMSIVQEDPARAAESSAAFDAWLRSAVSNGGSGLVDWERAPGARDCHEREEHLLPLMVVAGAGGGEPGCMVYSETVKGLGVTITNLRFG